MSFTAKLLKIEKRGSEWKLVIRFTDGTDVRIESYRFNGTTIKQLKNFVRSKANELAAIKTIDFSQYAGKELDLTPEPVTPTPDPTPEEIAKAKWFKDWRKLNTLIQLRNNGVDKPSDIQLIIDLQISVLAGRKNSYLGNI